MARSQIAAAADAQSAIERLLALPAFGTPASERRPLMLAAMQEAYDHHFSSCEAYAAYCRRRGFDEATRFERLEDFPYLPTDAFKRHADRLVSVAQDKVSATLQSSATSGQPSTVLIDTLTARRQVQVLAPVIAATLGSHRRPFIICDVDPAGGRPGMLGARSAAVRGFLNLARETIYVLEEGRDGRLQVAPDKLEAALKELRGRGEPFAIMGFTYVLFESVMEPLLGQAPTLDCDAHLIHIGGWKRLEDRKVSRSIFNAAARQVFGCPADKVIDFYGFTEQMGLVYPAVGNADRVAPAYAEVIVRDPETHQPLPPGQPGLLQFLTPVPHSYPGISVITDDLGMLTEPPEGGPYLDGQWFQVLGRAKNAEVRGCGDVMADKMAVRGSLAQTASNAAAPARLLFHRAPYLDVSDPVLAVDVSALPVVEDMGALAEELRRGREVLDTYSFDELAMLVGAAARRWAAPDSSLGVLRAQGLSFLERWCQPHRLARLGDEALRGARGHLDGFRTAGAAGRQIRAYPRGLVSHWLSGNVPLLGMLALTQSILTRNANLVKSASSFSSALPALLEAFRGLEVASPTGRVLRGDDILRSIAVVYFPHENRAAGTAMSAAADVRVAWGGREAVEAIGTLPRRYDAEDVMFGPKLSYMAIGHELLGSDRAVRGLARRAAIDASVFDQYACASPHTIFVEGGDEAARGFATALAEEMARTARIIPKAPIDPATAARIMRVRMQAEFEGELWASPGMAWTVLYDDNGPPVLAEPCYSRVITVRPVDDVMATADLASADIQTIGLGLSGARRQAYADRAARRGAFRFPDIGRATEFDSVWDGLYMMDRFVKWVSLGGPLT